MDLFEKSQQTLELPAVMELLAAEAVSEPAKELVRTLSPSIHAEEIRRRLAETTSAKDLMVYKGSPAFSGLRVRQASYGLSLHRSSFEYRTKPTRYFPSFRMMIPVFVRISIYTISSVCRKTTISSICWSIFSASFR